jgi:hypothetical protein
MAHIYNLYYLVWDPSCYYLLLYSRDQEPHGKSSSSPIFIRTNTPQLEELDEIFNSRNPVKTSIAKKRLGFDEHGEVVNIQDA